MIFTTYDITNTINDKYYIGAHKTINIHDDYYGSGKLIKRALIKYGQDKFMKVINGVWKSEEIMFLIESWILTENDAKNENCYNLREGGSGGWGHISYEQTIINSHKGVAALQKKRDLGLLPKVIMSEKSKKKRRDSWSPKMRKDMGDKMRRQIASGKSKPFGKDFNPGTKYVAMLWNDSGFLIDTFFGDFTKRCRADYKSFPTIRQSMIDYNKTGKISKIRYVYKNKRNNYAEYEGWFVTTIQLPTENS